MQDRFDKAIDYFPLLAYFGFWLQGAAISSVITGEPKLMALGFVTAPAVAAMILAIIKIKRTHDREPDKKLGITQRGG